MHSTELETLSLTHRLDVNLKTNQRHFHRVSVIRLESVEEVV